MLLIQDGGESNIYVADSMQRAMLQDYKLLQGDIIDIKVSSLDPQSVAIFNKTISGIYRNQETPSSLYINGYIIDGFGEINMPLIGAVKVEGITIDSLRKVLEVELQSYFKHFTVSTKLINYRVSILGEVNLPGVQYVYNNNTNVLQAIAAAGGIKDYGNRSKVKVIRRTQTGTVSKVLDMKDEDVVKDEFFYVLPEDVIYIEPLKSKAASINIPLASLIISAFSFGLVLINSFSTN